MLAALWMQGLAEDIRELDYMAQLGGIKTSLGLCHEYITINLDSYNENLESYFLELFRKFQNFNIEEGFFNDICQSMLLNYKNRSKMEPYIRLNDVIGEAMFGHDSCEEKIKIIQNIHFQKFMAFKDKFFKNLNFKWFIGGHLTQERAQKIFDGALSHIEHTCLNEADTKFNRNMIELPDKTVHDIN